MKAHDVPDQRREFERRVTSVNRTMATIRGLLQAGAGVTAGALDALHEADLFAKRAMWRLSHAR